MLVIVNDNLGILFQAIDVWFIFCMVFNFFIIVVLVTLNVFWEIQRNNKRIKVYPKGKLFSNSELKSYDITKWNYYMKILFPVWLLISVCIYVAYIALK